MDVFFPHLEALIQSGREIVICGDWNIAHREIDLKNWKSNQKNSGFLPEERAWMTRLFDELGWVDVYRSLYPHHEGEAYTWWSNRARPGEERRLAHRLPDRDARHRRQSEIRPCLQDQRFSDHAPLIVDYITPHDRTRPSLACRPCGLCAPARRRHAVPRFSAGLPLLLVLGTLSFWLSEAGIARATIGHLSWSGWPTASSSCGHHWWTGSTAVPDGAAGKRRAWLLLSQVCIAAALLGMANTDPVLNLTHTVFFALAVAFASATQDIALDAYRIEAVETEKQGAMAATYQAATASR